MIRPSIAFIAVAVLACAACKKKEEGGASAAKEPAAPADKPAPAAPAPEPAAPAGPKVFEYPTAQAFNDDYRSVKGAAFMDKFGLDGRFRFAGTVDTVITEESGDSKIGLKLDGNKRVSLEFADSKAVAAKGLKKGDAIKVLCDAGGADDNMIMLLRCTLE